jgi:hypothetical protein
MEKKENQKQQRRESRKDSKREEVLNLYHMYCTYRQENRENEGKSKMSSPLPLRSCNSPHQFTSRRIASRGGNVGEEEEEGQS